MLILACVLATACILQFIIIFRWSRIIFSFESEIEECLDEIDSSYATIAEILERPLFYDSPEVREVLNKIKVVNASFLTMAHRLANIQSVQDEEPEE